MNYSSKLLSDNHDPTEGLAEHAGLSYQQSYRCPVCRHGQIEALTLMDAFACSFCRHIFTANLQEQLIRVEDSSQPLAWRWTGRTWRPIQQDDFDLTLVIWLVGVALVSLPPALLWLPDSTWYWFPLFWTIIAFLAHFSLVLWLLAEHYQFPTYIALRIQLQRWLGQP
jgi:rubredoxin